MSTKTRIRLILFIACVVLAAAAVGDATASPPASANGTLTYQGATFNSVREAGGNIIIDLSATVAYTGTFTGTSTLHGTLIFHTNGTANFHDVETFIGTVNGVPGTVTFNLDGSSDASAVVSATDVIVSASGELAGLHGALSEAAVVYDPAIGPVGTYTGQIDFGG